MAQTLADVKNRVNFAPAIMNNSLVLLIIKNAGLVVQLVRIRACHARGRGFESRPDRQFKVSPSF